MFFAVIMELKSWHKYFNYLVLVGSIFLGVMFLLPDSGFHYAFGLGAFLITALFVINHFLKINITIIFVIMICYMLAGLLNWPLGEGSRAAGLADLMPALWPFIGFIILALLYWENRNKF